jgi:hypothetical protein
MLFTGYYDSFIQILGETAWWHTAPKSAQITDVSCNAVNIAPSALQVLGGPRLAPMRSAGLSTLIGDCDGIDQHEHAWVGEAARPWVA